MMLTIINKKMNDIFQLQHLFLTLNLRGIFNRSKNPRLGRCKSRLSGFVPLFLSFFSILLIVYSRLSSSSKLNVPPLRTVLPEIKLVPSCPNLKLFSFPFLIDFAYCELDFVDFVNLSLLTTLEMPAALL
jgi:hypothetical protein